MFLFAMNMQGKERIEGGKQRKRVKGKEGNNFLDV